MEEERDHNMAKHHLLLKCDLFDDEKSEHLSHESTNLYSVSV